MFNQVLNRPTGLSSPLQRGSSWIYLIYYKTRSDVSSTGYAVSMGLHNAHILFIKPDLKLAKSISTGEPAA